MQGAASGCLMGKQEDGWMDEGGTEWATEGTWCSSIFREKKGLFSSESRRKGVVSLSLMVNLITWLQ